MDYDGLRPKIENLKSLKFKSSLSNFSGGNSRGTCHQRCDPSLDLLRRHLYNFLGFPRVVLRLVKAVNVRRYGAAHESLGRQRIVEESDLERRDPVLPQVNGLLQLLLVPRVDVQTSSVNLYESPYVII